MFPGTNNKFDNSEHLLELFEDEKHTNRILENRQKLFSSLIKKYNQGKVLFFGAFQIEGMHFKQDANVSYISNINEPGIIFFMDINGTDTKLFIPKYKEDRRKWVGGKDFEQTTECAAYNVVDEIVYLGESQPGYTFSVLMPDSCFEEIITYIKKAVSQKENIFISLSNDIAQKVQQLHLLEKFKNCIPDLKNKIIDITQDMILLRNNKSNLEIDCILESVEIIRDSMDQVATILLDETNEAAIEFLLQTNMRIHGFFPAYTPIVAGGKNATILHYTDNNKPLKKGELLLIDSGASYYNYCSDITRVFPISGSFTKRQREIYQLVLDTQEYIADIARAGMWLHNKENPELSLQHLAIAYLQERGGYHIYFTHGIGHHLGLEVHDIADRTKPLMSGDVITIEPGIYIENEGIGIRIEDNYRVLPNGSLECLSYSIPKEIDDIEAMVQHCFDWDAFEKKS